MSNRTELYRLLKTGGFFVTPFLCYFLMILLVDPFNYFRYSTVISQEAKRLTAGKFHYALWKSIEYKRSPSEYVLFGDSRMGSLDKILISRLSGDQYFNFSFGGGTVSEMVDAFWFSTELADLKSVYLGIGFINFNSFQNMNRFEESNSILDNKLLYLVNKTVLKSAIYSVYVEKTQQKPDVERPSMDKAQFWDSQLHDVTTAFLRNYRYPQEYLTKLQEIATYCSQNDIKLTFIIPPVHTDLLNRFAEFGLEDEQIRFGFDLRKIAPVIDFAFPNSFTQDRANFGDPYHYSVAEVLEYEIWSASERSEISRN